MVDFISKLKSNIGNCADVRMEEQEKSIHRSVMEGIIQKNVVKKEISVTTL